MNLAKIDPLTNINIETKTEINERNKKKNANQIRIQRSKKKRAQEEKEEDETLDEIERNGIKQFEGGEKIIIKYIDVALLAPSKMDTFSVEYDKQRKSNQLRV